MPVKKLPGACQAGGSPGNTAETQGARVKRQKGGHPVPKTLFGFLDLATPKALGFNINQLIECFLLMVRTGSLLLAFA